MSTTPALPMISLAHYPGLVPTDEARLSATRSLCSSILLLRTLGSMLNEDANLMSLRPREDPLCDPFPLLKPIRYSHHHRPAILVPFETSGKDVAFIILITPFIYSSLPARERVRPTLPASQT